MQIKTKGVISSISDAATTIRGTALQQISLMQETGILIHPVARGVNINLIKGLSGGDKVEIEYHAEGYVTQTGSLGNNVIIDNLVRL